MLRPDEPHADELLTMVADTGRFLQDEEYLMTQIHQSAPELIAKAAWHGYLPMYAGSGTGLILLKLHKVRSLLSPGSVHIGKQCRKKAAQFRISVNEAFADVVSSIQTHTFTAEPGDCWLNDEFVAMYTAVNRLPDALRKGVKFHSVELWHIASGKLAAGEIGYTVGAIYSSCSGFALKKEFAGAGTLQLAALGKLLERSGFRLWDLGMGLEYKKELGATLESRAAWIACLRQFRGIPVSLHSPDASLTAKDLIGCAAEGIAEETVQAERL